MKTAIFYGEKGRGMPADLGVRRIPEAEFVARIDDLLQKSTPEQTIPWSVSPPPEWAKRFRPRRIIDLGAGVGGFTHSVLLRLGQWGCLDNLEQVVLIESDCNLLPGGEPALRAHLLRQVKSALAAGEGSGATIDIRMESIELREAHGGGIAIPLLEPYRDTDLIVASHLTYYFGDGSGRELLRCLGARYLSVAGRIWCVIRKRACPIYHVRARMLKDLAVTDVKPFDYAEYFESDVLPSLSSTTLLAAEDQAYLIDSSFPGREEAIHLLMWRQMPSTNRDDPYRRAVAEIVAENAALFVERHFILGRCR